ncbi:MAG: hypothetical protein CMC96_07115 [Flavobacteriales bacterium]|nr:hypothetical protein [Flavobacteriales bacterium]
MMQKIIPILCFFAFCLVQDVNAQCFQVNDGTGTPSNNPYFIHCSPANYTVFIQVDQNIGPYIIDWGDGSPNTTGASLTTTGLEQHTYTATTDTFNITITDQNTSCVVNGVVVMERNPLASIQLPSGDDNFGCTPVQFRFVNSSTQISETTTFTWDFGDGSPTETYDYTNLGDTVYHTYQPGVGVQSCDLEVTLTATNYCGSSTASFFPLKVWDLDEAVITPSATLLCYPDTIVQYTNNTIRNCFPEGNNSQRYEKWNFGDYWGLGYDSIIDWRPWNPPIINPPPMAYPGVGTYTATLIDSSFCGLDTSSVSITITSPPTAGLSANKDSICAGETVLFQNNTIGGANRFEWNFDQGAGWQNLGGGNQNVSYNTPGDYTIRLAVGINGANGCTDTAEVDLHVYPAPNADFNFDTNNECDSMSVNFSDQSSGTIVDWQWRFDNGNTFSGQSPPTQFYGSPGMYRVTLITTNNQGCIDSVTKNINVRERPTAAFSVASVCLNQPANFVDQSTANLDPIVSYKWYFGDGDSSSAQDPSHLYTAFGTFTVIQIVDNGYCTDSDTLTVTVEEPPIADFSMDTTNGCSPLSVNFNNLSSANAASFRWFFGDGSAVDTTQNPTHTYMNNGTEDTTYYIQLIARTTFGCADTITDSVVVSPLPLPSFTSDAVVDCGPVEVNFTNTTPGSNLNFYWNFGDSSAISTQENPTHIFENKTLFINNYTVSLIVESANGCRDTTSQIVQIYPEPNFNFSANPDSGCSPLSVRFPSVVGAVNYQWDFGDGNSASGPTPVHTFVNNTTNNQVFTVQLIAQNSFGCIDTTTADVLVFPNPTSSFSLDTNKGCQPLPITITNNSTGANSYHWDFGDGTTSDTTDATFIKTYYNQSQLVVFNDIQLITETPNGCSDTASRRVEVNPFVKADFISDSMGCSPLSIDFRERSTGAQTYEWRFGDGGFSPQANPRHFFINSGQSDTVFTTTLKVTSARGCIDSLEKDITVFPKPIADFLTNVNNGCQPLPVDFTNQSQLGDSCVWNFGDGNNTSSCGQLINHTYRNEFSIVPVNYKAELIVYTNQGCSDTLSRNITVNPQVIADFTADTVGCSPLESTFRAQSFGATNFYWDFGDGRQRTGLIAVNNYTNTGSVDSIYTARLIAQSIYQCEDTAYQDILVRPTPIPDFVATPTFQVYPNATVNLTNTTNAGNWDFLWDFDDSTTSNLREPGTHTYNSWGQYWIKLKASTPYCSDSIRKLVEIDVPIPVADFSDSASGCEPLEVQFVNESQYGASYEWDFGDGNTSNVENPFHVYYEAGTYDVRLSVKGFAPNKEATEIKQRYIQVYKRPRAGFLANKEVVYIPNDPLVLSNISKDADAYQWDFGDGNTSTEQSPVHYYQEEGEFEIALVASAINGCRDTFLLPTQIIGQLEGRIEVPNAFTPSTSGGSGGVVNPNNPATMNDVFYAKINGAAKYELNIFNKWGELLFVSKDINIGWDGYYKGELCKQDVYVWKIKAEFVDGETVVKVGDLMLLR